MGRTVIIGDVHGCTGELEELLEKVHFAENDALVFVGDLVARGPDSTGAIALARRLRARVTRGNHEEKLLAWRSRGKPLGPEHARIAKMLSTEDWQMLEAMPLWIDLHEHGIRVVHAGIVPGLGIEGTPPEAMLKMRTLDNRGRWSDASDAGPLWGARYEGMPHVVFGHNAQANPQLHAWATGIDTACVYGGRLTALVLEEGEPMARGDAARGLLKSVPALRAYWHGSGTQLTR